MIQAFSAILLAFTVLAAPPASRSAKSVPNPRPKGQWIVDEAGVLSPDQRSRLNANLTSLERATSVEFAVVILKSIGTQVPKEFATALFNHWGVGKRKNDNGLLLLMVMDQKRLEFETGYGLEGVLPDVVLSRVLHNMIVPAIQAGNPGSGLEQGILRIQDILTKKEVRDEVFAEASRAAHPPSPYADLWLVFFGGGVLLFAGYVLRSLHILFSAEDPYLRYKGLNGWLLFSGIFGFLVILFAGAVAFLNWNEPVSLAVISPLGGLAVYGVQTWLRRLVRRAPRRCSACGEKQALLDEQADDAYLDKKQVFEEGLQSMDYDVWVCPGCRAFRVDAYDGEQASSFTPCVSCGTRAEKLMSTITLVPATTASSGRGRKTFECLQCKKSRHEDYSIAQISTSSSSSGGFSSGGSSGGGSFGGGRSGGGGAGASW